MAWLLNRQEKEDYVIRLYKEGKSIREIAELVHMSFRDIGTITNKVKLQADRERGYITVDTEPKSKESQAFKLFSEGKSPVEVAIALDLDAGRVRAIYYDYWELKGMFKLAQIYMELGREDLLTLVTLHKIFKHLGMKEHDMFKVLELAKHIQLERLQGKVEYLENQIFVLEDQKTKAINDILTLNRAINQLESSLPQKRGEEMTYMNQGRGWYDDTTTDNLYPIPYSEPYTNSYSIQLSYSDSWPPKYFKWFDQ
ncbi:MAG: hypothetical protein WCC17_05565 [Candidatus Nitrosopolaris sp.]